MLYFLDLFKLHEILPFFCLFVHIDAYGKLMYNKVYICNF